MWTPLKTLTVALGVQHSASKVVAQVAHKDTAKIKLLETAGGHSTLQHASEPGGAIDPDRSLVEASSGQHVVGGFADQAGHVALQDTADLKGFLYIRVEIFRIRIEILVIWDRRLQAGTTDAGAEEVFTIVVTPVITDPVNGKITLPEQVVSVNGDQLADVSVPLTSDQLNADDTALCDECTFSYIAGECLSGDCELYDQDGTNANNEVVSEVMSDDPQVSGDPHMVGLLGQKIDWYGEDSGWYCLLANSEFQVNARVTAPMPEEFPTRQLVSGVSIRSAGGPSLVVEVKNPYTTETEGCSSTSAACLAEGALRILVDGDESHALQSPVEELVLPGGDLVVSSANLPVECRPFGGDRIWAAQFAAMTDAIGRRSLRGRTPFVDWMLEADTMAAPGWCALFVREQGSGGLSSVQSNHAILRVETGGVTVRVNVGVNYQDSVLSSHGHFVVVPELDFWQIDLAFEELRPSGELGGMLGDTARYVIGDDGKPITSSMEALHGPVETYRVSGPLGVDFEQMHGGAVEQGTVFA